MSVFVDSSMFYASVDRGDRDYERAKRILGSDESLVTSDHVIVETWLLIHRRINRATADLFWAGLRSGAARVESVGPADLEAAWGIGERFPDQDFSIVDRTSFAMMERLGIFRVATFDDDFAVYRFGPKRTRAFEVVR
jgi:predicted nucleic acid-binding protein